ncbi:pyruvate dehydrogenase (acetyl-transferring) E1 component subunit alpha [Actinotalea sp. BY-33]|uniref:Pyruvate dehydrogenase (Acetyl-transferring) E1 component subunit alpha n=1 Tax=Actinotalea soli TaxID=2819234 RepID=A0A939RVK7_9CELL|nr:thiamine pyrophosphate-dependent enzyme [Actinotalea soli]MBO1752500.1 pyruvate dehydrogenase (acetyl-transferring) E1 component subunit alpha [Actinotalea soli]
MSARPKTPRPPKSAAPCKDEDIALAFYRQMVLIRRFEERAARGYAEAKIGGYCHLNLGEEATVVGLMAALQPDDYVYASYRDHGYALARGISPERVMAELYGRTDGVSKGWGGSMHLFDVDARLMGGYGIVGGQVPLATGAALAVAHRGGAEAVLCQMGDGTTNIGAFHESLNLASLWDLPIVFVVSNNGLGMGTTVEGSSAEPDLFKRASAYRMASERVDGNDPVAVHAAALRALTHARSGKPFLLETVTERLKGHSVVDPAGYRTREQKAQLLAGDALSAYAARLTERAILTDDATREIDEAAMAAVDASVRFADASAHPATSTLFDYTYATAVPNDSRRLPGQPLFPAAARPGETMSEKAPA